MLLTARLLLAICALCVLPALIACEASNPPIYRWGIYETQIYDNYRSPGETDPVNAALALSADVERTLAEGKSVPPGVYAHLGYLYSQQGDLDRARQAFARERALFPESATFVDGIVDRMGRT